ncbi:hypothetical protein RB979_001387 [Vibrio alginolyticus]|uniref:hypothetical protein n=1 Tax=Vibrio TaxID=662 RepID=UPI001BD4A785|nr:MULTISPECIES: hypothetical protein [Vibrio]ELA6645887.1 hypothetical protein [Vibrio alginolyticus]ELA6779168.1 hypothetical protein [Vibrio alginolyticus]MBS9910074.1 hypothetical protein [Vibrio alginolyticus]MBT0047675.1 hypothetical protein [Vibrio alginolyticus]MBT0061613.1 hypothetical protein [Vibrio alginolyticus]
MNGWDFEQSEYWYQINPELIKFDGDYNGIRCLFGVSVSAINNAFGDYDSRENAEEQFESNMEYFHNLAVEAAYGNEPESEDFDEPPFYFINI